MQDTFPKALAFALRWEGGYSNDPDDPGGATNKGITQKTYDGWRLKQGLSLQTVQSITDEEVATIYRNEYWNSCGCDALAYPMDMVAFDGAVNCGPRRVKIWKRQAQDAEGLLNLRASYYKFLIRTNPKLSKFEKGWLNRINALRKEIAN